MRVRKVSPRVYEIVDDCGVVIEVFHGNGKRAHARAAILNERANRVTAATLRQGYTLWRDARPTQSAGEINNMRKAYAKPGPVRDLTHLLTNADGNLTWAMERHMEKIGATGDPESPHDRDSGWRPEYYQTRRPWRKGGRPRGVVR